MCFEKKVSKPRAPFSFSSSNLLDESLGNEVCLWVEATIIEEEEDRET